jgi:uncharacterized protein (TIGR02246 family)
MSIRNIVSGFLLCGIIFSSVFAAPPTLTDTQRVEIEKAVQQINDNVLKAAAHVDVDKMFSFILDDADGVMIQNGNLILTKDEAVRQYKQAVANIQKLEYQFDHQIIHVLSPESALVVCDGISIGTTMSGNTFRVPFAQTIVYVLRDGQWKVIHTHASGQGQR